MASLNAGPEYYHAEEKYHDAGTIEEKIAALQEMLKFCPKHKAAHSILTDIKSKLGRYRKEAVREELAKRGRKGGGSSGFVRKQGGAQVIVLGFPNSGKSVLVNLLAGTRLASTDTPFETKQAAPAMMDYNRVQIQLVDTPSGHEGNKLLLFAMARAADLALVLIDGTQDVAAQKAFFGSLKHKRRLDLHLHRDAEKHAGEIRDKIYSSLRIVRVFTRSKNGKDDRPIVLFEGATAVRDAARTIHKDFFEHLKCARVWGSTRFPGQQVGASYALRDGDTVELEMHTNRDAV